MAFARFLFFSGKSGNIRPAIVFLVTLFLLTLLAVSVMEILVLVFGALGVAPPIGAIDFCIKLKVLAVKLIHHAK